jgi:hypothetical protein
MGSRNPWAFRMVASSQYPHLSSENSEVNVRGLETGAAGAWLGAQSQGARRSGGSLAPLKTSGPERGDHPYAEGGEVRFSVPTLWAETCVACGSRGCIQALRLAPSAQPRSSRCNLATSPKKAEALKLWCQTSMTGSVASRIGWNPRGVPPGQGCLGRNSLTFLGA